MMERRKLWVYSELIHQVAAKVVPFHSTRQQDSDSYAVYAVHEVNEVTPRIELPESNAPTPNPLVPRTLDPFSVAICDENNRAKSVVCACPRFPISQECRPETQEVNSMDLCVTQVQNAVGGLWTRQELK